LILRQLSNREGEARKKYRRFVEEGMKGGVEDPLKKTVASTVLGSEAEIGEFFAGIGPSAVTQNNRRLLPLLEGDLELKETVQRLKSRLSE
jgi:hypothetical protein